LFCKLLFAFFGVDENIIGIAEMFLPALPSFPVLAPIVKLKLVQVLKKFLVEFGLQPPLTRKNSPTALPKAPRSIQIFFIRFPAVFRFEQCSCGFWRIF
jgi:hypothetical protein